MDRREFEPQRGQTRIAAVLVVKDEIADLPYWLAWHLSVGCDTLFVFDDGSRDGTIEVARAAAAKYDVRTIRIEPSDDDEATRRRKAYERVLRDHAQAFDWVGFLDIDEYVLVNYTGDLKSLFEQIPEADAVAFNRCNYGSSDTVLRPNGPPMFTFRKHAAREEHWNQGVKSFVRPRAVENHFIDSHRFAVDLARYRRPTGEPVRWHGDTGVTEDPADWSVARIMHFRNRSLEHFVASAKKSEQRKTATPADFLTAESNAQEDDVRFHNERRFFEILMQIGEAYNALVAADITSARFGRRLAAEREDIVATADIENESEATGDSVVSAEPAAEAEEEPAFALALGDGDGQNQAEIQKAFGWVTLLREARRNAAAKAAEKSSGAVDGADEQAGAASTRSAAGFTLYHLSTVFGTRFVVDAETGLLGHAKPRGTNRDYGRAVEVVLARSDLNDRVGFLFVPWRPLPLRIEGDGRVTRYPSVVVRNTAIGSKVALTHPGTGRYFTPDMAREEDAIFGVRADTWRMYDWEQFDLHPLSEEQDRAVRADAAVASLIATLQTAKDADTDLTTLRAWLTDLPGAAGGRALQIALAGLNADDRHLLESLSAVPILGLV